jgi:hypothetical protein
VQILSFIALATFLGGHLVAQTQSPEEKVRVFEYTAAGPIRDVALPPTSSPSESASNAVSVPPPAKAISMLIFPILDVYSPKGLLIYHGTYLSEIDNVVRHFPRSARLLSPLSGTETLSSVVARFPTLGRCENNPSCKGAGPSYTFVILQLEECEACHIESNILSRERKRLLAHHAEIRILALFP